MIEVNKFVRVHGALLLILNDELTSFRVSSLAVAYSLLVEIA